MEYKQVRLELRRMRKGDLFKLVVGKKISKCLIKDVVCPLLFQYKKLNFCLSEIMGKSCHEKRKKIERTHSYDENLNFSLPLKYKEDTKVEKIEEIQTKGIEFNVYYRSSPSSFLFLGKVIERRNEERENNLIGLLNKARKEFLGQVKDPSLIFLLGP